MYNLMQDTEPRRVVVYARVSTEHEAQLSALENQMDWYDQLIDGHKEWTLVDKYIDEGITGTSAKKRPEFMRMIRDAQQHKFDMIITREVSRFARNTVDTLEYTRKLKRCGVEVYFVSDNIRTFEGDGELRLTIMATLAQDESRKTSLRSKAGQTISMKNGVFYGTGNILGYDRVGKKMVINPEQAETVRMIFDLYLSGKGLKAIRLEMEARGRKTSSGKTRWYDSYIARVLHNTFYCGIITYRKEYVPDFLEQKKIKNKGEVEQIQTIGSHVPIVTVEEFERVQARMKQSRTQHYEKVESAKLKGTAPKRNIWSKLLVCECGYSFNCHTFRRPDGNVNRLYICYRQANTGTIQSRKNHGLDTSGCCSTRAFPEWKLDMIAMKIFREYISNADKVVNLAAKMIEEELRAEDEETDNSYIISVKIREIDKLRSKLTNYIELRAEGEITKEEYLLKKAEINKRIELNEADIAKLEPQDVEPRDYEAMMRSLRADLEKYVDFDNMTQVPEDILEAFIEKIVVHEDSMEWYLRTSDIKPDSVNWLKINGLKNEEQPVQNNTSVTRLFLDSFVLKFKDAREYLYAISNRKRIYNWFDVEVQLFA